MSFSRILWLPVNVVQMLVLVTWVFISSITVMLLSVFNKYHLPMRFGYRIWGPFFKPVLGMSVKVRGSEHIPDEPVIFCCNHSSLVDIPIVMMTTRKPLYFIAKKELKRVPFLGWCMIMAGCLFVDRSNKTKAIQSMAQAGRQIRRGKYIISFPEGTRSRDGAVHVFKRGTFIMAARAAVPIVPIGIWGADRILPPDSIRMRPGTVGVVIGKPISTDGVDPTDVDAFANHVREVVVGLRKEAAHI